jgi:radical SAM protein with 4Fe4S-binding SPASM domain
MKYQFLRKINRKVNDWEFQFQRKKLISYPVKIDIVPTMSCNLNCVFCIKYRTSKRVLTLTDFKKIADSLFPFASEVFFCSGGEPFMNENFMKFLKVCRDYNIKFNITTNGTLLNKSNINQLFDNPFFQRINISFDGYKKETVEEIRKGVNYLQVVSNIKLLLKERKLNNREEVEVNIRYAIMKRNIEELLPLVKKADEFGVNKVVVDYLNITNNIPDQESLYYHPQLTERVFKKVMEYAEKRNIEINLPTLPTDKVSPKKCKFPWEFVKIDPDGTVRFCYNSWNAPIGNIFETKNFRQIWNNQIYQNIRLTVNRKKCYYKYCSNCEVKKGFYYKDAHFFGNESQYEFK